MRRTFGFPVGVRVTVLTGLVIALLLGYRVPPGTAPGEHGGTGLAAILFTLLATVTFAWSAVDAGRLSWQNDLTRWGVTTTLVGLSTVTVAALVTIGDEGTGVIPPSASLIGDSALLALLLLLFATAGIMLGRTFWDWHRGTSTTPTPTPTPAPARKPGLAQSKQTTTA